MLRCFRSGLLLAFFASFLGGCGGEKMIKVQGKLLKGGQPMVVSDNTYVTISFIRESSKGDGSDAKSFSAKFEQKTGTYSVELPAGNYKVMVVVALPKKDGSPAAPSQPVKADKVYELKANQDLDIEVPGK